MREAIDNTFHQFALPITWDFCEGNPFADDRQVITGVA